MISLYRLVSGSGRMFQFAQDTYSRDLQRDGMMRVSKLWKCVLFCVVSLVFLDQHCSSHSYNSFSGMSYGGYCSNYNDETYRNQAFNIDRTMKNEVSQSYGSFKDSTTSFDSKRDKKFMRRAINLALQAMGNTRPNPCVGCVIVNDGGEIVGEGFHKRAGNDSIVYKSYTL